MTNEERYELCERIAQKRTDDASEGDLMEYFFTMQMEDLEEEGLSDEELLELAEEEGVNDN